MDGIYTYGGAAPASLGRWRGEAARPCPGPAILPARRTPRRVGV